jgi:hypothetical protein
LKYFFDTEFIEDGRTIDLISIGIVAEDGREYYAISTEFDESKASDWVKENVIAHLPKPEMKKHGDYWLQHWPVGYVPHSEIAEEVLAFVGDDTPEFWAYYADYDWVAFCQLFGTMMDLPKGWPYFCLDIKQLADSLGNPKLPEQSTTEHHALEDARWNKQAYDFLMVLK